MRLLAARASIVSSTALLASAGAYAQDLQPGANYASTPGKVAQTTSYVEAVRSADFDQDGDLDAFLTSGGAFTFGQSRLWKSNASTAGGAFTFSDATAASLPVLLAQSQSVEPFDVDGDGDLDLHVTNTSQFFAESNLWLINQGGLQAGTPGVFLLDLTRYSGIGLGGSSVPGALAIGSGAFAGGFADWSHGCDFADVDLDGDFDLLQLSVGPSVGGSMLHRMFLNNGAGFFSEYNPSGAVTGTTSLAAGSAAGWAQGIQSAGTSDTTGALHDVTGVSYDADFGDLDQDLDLDLVIQGRSGQSRFYFNQFVENGFGIGSEGAGTRLYRDVTGFAAGTAQSGGLCQNVELFDVDGDDDLDAWAVNYSSLADRILINNGLGELTSIGSALGDPSQDENEVDVVDYDGDGDLDLAVANFAGTNWIYKNSLVQGGSAASGASLLQRTGVLGTETELATPGGVADSFLSGEVGDLDNDSDADLLFSHDGAATSTSIQINTLGVGDLVAPRIPLMTQFAGSTAASAAPRRIVAQCYDNAAQEQFRTATATLEFTVNGGAPIVRNATWAGGNLFRSEIPGWWYGNVQYQMKVTDRAGHQGASAVQSVNVTTSNVNAFGTGTAGCSGAQVMSVNSAPILGNTDFTLHTTHCPQSALNLVLVTSGSIPGGADSLSLGLTLYVDVFSAELYSFDMPSDVSGLGTTFVPLSPVGPAAGSTYTLQTISYWGAGPCSPSPFNFSSSNAVTLTFTN